MDFYIRIYQYWSTRKDLDISILDGQLMQSRGRAGTVGE